MTLARSLRLMMLLPAIGFSAGSPGVGVSEELARDRAANLGSVRYELAFVVPMKPADAVTGTATIRFVLAAPREVVIDFDQPRESVQRVYAAGGEIAADFADGHILVPAAATKAGENAISIDFRSGDAALNRHDDYLYTLFVPARARQAFPCFDQPDMKARYSLTVEAPATWQVVANGPEQQRMDADSGRVQTHFAETKEIPTYLFAWAAGNFQVETAERNGRRLRMFHRETDPANVARNRDAIFDLHARALAWLEDYTAIEYPWGKFDFVLIPDFQFGGMEHPGAIFYSASRLLLSESATQNQYLARASVISHETAHMWFGDLVTMRWFNDVWLKEVMANLMAGKMVNPSFPELNHDLRFLMDHYPAAYSIDRTAGTNPIRQSLANLDEAGMLYGPIIYDKAPVVMRQLESMMGEQAFRDGLRQYLKQFSFGNATWPELVGILDAGTPEDLAGWSDVWVEQRGRPEFTSERSASGIVLTQGDTLRRSEGGEEHTWTQPLDIVFGFGDSIDTVRARVSQKETRLTWPADRPQPDYILPNGDGIGYGGFLLDEPTLRYLADHLEDIPDALTRGSALVALWDNVLAGRFAPAELLRLCQRAVPREQDEQNLQLMLGYISRVYWNYLAPGEREARAAGLESLLRENLTRARTTSLKAAWFATFRRIALTGDGLGWLQRIWGREEMIEGLPLSETDEIDMALELAVREIPDWQEILKIQLERTLNPDRKARLEFLLPAVSANPAVRQRAFDRLADAANRRREPWVLASLGYLHHPLREEQAEKYIAPGLGMLPEIQRTGDIFFPARWMNETLGGHRSPAAARAVREYLASHPELPERLRWTILAAADELLRANP